MEEKINGCWVCTILQFNLDRLVRMELKYRYVYVYTTCSNENQVRVHHVCTYV